MTSPQLLSAHSSGVDLKAILPPHLVSLAHKTGNIPIDRFGGIEPPKGIIVDPDVAYKYPGHSLKQFGEICDERAAEIASLDMPIVVYWSGGIDSTVALVALLKADIKPVVCMNNASILENGVFYDRFVKDQLPILSSVPASRALLARDSVLVTGELMDQLFGADIEHAVTLTSGWRVLHEALSFSTMIVVWTRLGFSAEHAASLCADVMSSANAAGVQLQTVHDFFWWMNFAFKWQGVKHRMLMYSPLEEAKLLKESDRIRLIHFPNTKDFQTWSCSRHERKILDRWETYKITAKRYIYRFDGNEDYLNHAVKIGSLRDFGVRAEHVRRITADHEMLGAEV